MRVFFSGDEDVCKRHLPVVQARAYEFAKLTEKRGLKQNAFSYSFDDTGATVRGAYVFGELSVSIDAPLVSSDPKQRAIRTERNLYEWNTVFTGDYPTVGKLGFFLTSSGALKIMFQGGASITVKGEVSYFDIDFKFDPVSILSGSGIYGDVTFADIYTLDLAVGVTQAGWSLVLVNFDTVYDNTEYGGYDWRYWKWYASANVALTDDRFESRCVDEPGDYQNRIAPEYGALTTDTDVMYNGIVGIAGQPSNNLFRIPNDWPGVSGGSLAVWPDVSPDGSLITSMNGIVAATSEEWHESSGEPNDESYVLYYGVKTTLYVKGSRRNKDKTTTSFSFQLFDEAYGPNIYNIWAEDVNGQQAGIAYFGALPFGATTSAGNVIITFSMPQLSGDPLPAYNYFAKGLGTKTWIAGYDSTVLGTISEHVVTAQDEPITLVKLNDGSGRFFKVLLFTAAEIKTLLSFNSVSGTTNCFFFYSPNLDLVVVRDAEAGNGIYRLVGDAYVQIQNGFDDLEPVYIAKDGTCVATKTNIYINGSAIEIPPVECVGVFWDHLHYVDRISVSQFAIKTMAGEVVATTDDGLYNFYELADDSSFAVFSKYYVSVEDDQTTDVALIIDFADGPLKFETTDTKLVQHIDPAYYIGENYDYYGWSGGVPFGRRYKSFCSCYCNLTGSNRYHAIYIPPQTWGKRMNGFGHYCELCVETSRIVSPYYDNHSTAYKHQKALCVSYSDAFNKRQVDGFPDTLRIHKHFWHPSIGYLERLLDTMTIIPPDYLHQITEQVIESE